MRRHCYEMKWKIKSEHDARFMYYRIVVTHLSLAEA